MNWNSESKKLERVIGKLARGVRLPVIEFEFGEFLIVPGSWEGLSCWDSLSCCCSVLWKQSFERKLFSYFLVR